jgi:hypothetical protein
LTDSDMAGEELVDPRWASMPASGETAGHAWSIAQTLGAELERVRLAHRARRIERVLEPPHHSQARWVRNEATNVGHHHGQELERCDS